MEENGGTVVKGDVTTLPDVSVQGDSADLKKDIEDSSAVKSSAPVSVIKSAPARTNGVHEEEEKESLTIQPPSEQLPAELLQEETGLTTVASLVDKAEVDEKDDSPGAPSVTAAASAEEPPAPAAPPAPVTAPLPATPPAGGAAAVVAAEKKLTAADISADWADGEDDEEEEEGGKKSSKEAATTADTVVSSGKTEEGEAAAAVEAADEDMGTSTADKSSSSSDAAGEAAGVARKSGRQPKPTPKKLEADEQKQEEEEAAEEGGATEEESVDAIAAELQRTASGSPKKAAGATKSPAKTPKSTAAAAAEDGGAVADGRSGGKKGRPKKKDLDEKVEHVTKLGNNMYFYTGPGGEDSPPPLHSDEEELEDRDLLLKEKKEKEEKDLNARKSSRPGKGRNPRLEREDEEVEIPKKLPQKPNLNPGWLKQAAKNMTPKSGKTPAKNSTPKTKPAESHEDLKSKSPKTPVAEAAASVLPPSEPLPEGTPPKDEELPKFDPEKFQPGYVPQVVKKGDVEYMIVVNGVQDTGLCGKYWGDLDNLPSRRRSKQPESFKAGESPDTEKRRGSVGSTGSAETPVAAKRGPKKQDTLAKKQVTKPEKPQRSVAADSSENESVASPAPAPAAAAAAASPATPAATPGGGAKRGRKRKVDSQTPASAKKPRSSQSEDDSVTGSASEMESSTPSAQTKKKSVAKSSPQTSSGAASKAPGSPDKKTEAIAARNAAAVSAALAAGVPAGQQRSVSCVADTSTQKEVVVECYAPYDDHRWVNIGKERDGMTPDAVQYARALRPPYHLLSFLRIKGHSTKGMSCTDKNTMVFVVLEGEITVILHTTQFDAKKGDSFYIPPKNYYNLINQKAREAELSLIQFQYDGPLPTVNPTQSQ